MIVGGGSMKRGVFFREILLQNLTRFVASRGEFEWIGGGGVSKSLEE